MGLLGWSIFLGFVVVMLVLDLGVFHREAHVISFNEALIWSVIWIGLALIFNGGVYYYLGSRAGLEFLTGYLIEKSLAVDNIFVFVIIFSYFQVPSKYQHKVLFWGILGALLMRGLMIWIGAILLKEFHWIIYIFGGFLLFTGIRMAIHSEHSFNPESNPLVKLVKTFLPFTEKYENDSFFARIDGKLTATPLFLVLILVEFTDLIFAVDSIPAIFAVTDDPFIVFSSNVFAILGLRALYFLLAGVVDKFHYLKLGLSIVLVFVGTKMLLTDIYKVPIVWSLAFIALVLGLSVLLSLFFPKKAKQYSPVKNKPL